MKKLILFTVIIFLGNSVFSQKADSIKYYKIQIKSLDSLLTAENAKKTVVRQMQYDFDKKMARNKAEQDIKDLIYMEERQKMKIIIYCLCFVSLIVMAFAFYVLKKVKQKK